MEMIQDCCKAIAFNCC